MAESEIILYVIKLVLGGLTALLAIMLWSKTRDAAWMALLSGIVINYSGTIYELLLKMKIIYFDKIMIFGLPLTSLVFTVVPQLLFIIALILMLVRNK